VFTQKLDGKRILAVVDSNERPAIVLYGRSGQLIRPLPGPLIEALRRLPEGRYVLDGELMLDGVYYLFDAPQLWPKHNNLVDITTPYAHRAEVLDGLAAHVWAADPRVQVLPRAATPEDKLKMFRLLREQRAEGVVCRQLTGSYLPGKRSPSMVKIKFVKTADCFVDRMSGKGKDSFVLAVYNEDGTKVDVGLVSRLVGDARYAQIRDVLEVQYLTFTASRRMREPTNPRLRPDKAPAECKLDQFFPVNMKQLAAILQL
jgi:ATP-dependent DNA ligase